MVSSSTKPQDRGEAIRQGFIRKFSGQVDPTGELPQREVKRRARQLVSEHFGRLGHLSVEARRQRRQNGGAE